MIADIIEPGVYRHYKGKLYEVITATAQAAWNSASIVVVYRDVMTGTWWVRERVEFAETVIDDAGHTVKRFAKLDTWP